MTPFFPADDIGRRAVRRTTPPLVACTPAAAVATADDSCCGRQNPSRPSHPERRKISPLRCRARRAASMLLHPCMYPPLHGSVCVVERSVAPNTCKKTAGCRPPQVAPITVAVVTPPSDRRTVRPVPRTTRLGSTLNTPERETGTCGCDLHQA